MNFGLEAQPGKFTSSKGLARVARILANLSGIGYSASDGANVAATLRHPYEYWSHRRPSLAKYARHHIMLADEFLKQVVDRGEASRLGTARGFCGRRQVEPGARRRVPRSEVRRQEILDGCC